MLFPSALYNRVGQRLGREDVVIAVGKNLRQNNVIKLGDAWGTNTVNTVIFRHHGIITDKNAYPFTSFYGDENTIQL